jgi:SAM-dependent methyltransferase
LQSGILFKNSIILNPMKKLVRNCPICNNSTGKTLHTQHFSLPDKSILPNVYDVVSCENCGFCYADSTASQEDYDKYYNEMSKYEDNNTGTGSGLSPLDKQRMDTVVDLLSNYIENKDNSIVDIGCANGGMLNCFNEKGFLNLIGIDISQKCVDNVKALGYESIFGGIFNLENLQGKQFDCLVISHVMEHIRDLSNAAKNLASLVSDEGLIYIEVPDASNYHNYFFVPYYYFDCEHINHLNITALKNLFLKESFECIYFEEKSIVVSNEKSYPVLRTIFKKVKNKTLSTHFEKDSRVEASINAYIDLSKKHSEHNELNELIKSQEPVLVWGAGMYTLRLLEEGLLNQCNIILFIDKDSNKQGNKINNISINSPEIINQYPTTTIIVASAIHGKAIKTEIESIDGNANRKIIIL